ncbi:MAG: hypothetical protein NZ741_13800 [Armatimonadetes bacterium]|nr:hypothetical protein [Armatimonadota bacterium]
MHPLFIVFQSLIGRLVTDIQQAHWRLLDLFQSLIGRLVTKPRRTDWRLVNRVSIPYR